MLARVRRLKVAKWRYFDGACRPFGARRDAAKVKGTAVRERDAVLRLLPLQKRLYLGLFP